MRPARHLAVRGLALFLGVFALANVVGGRLRPGFDANAWWIDLRPLPRPLADLALASLGALLVAWAARPAAGPIRRRATRIAAWSAAVVAAGDAVAAWALAARGEVEIFPVPFSLFAAAALAWAGTRAGTSEARTGGAAVVPAAAGWAVVFALLQMVCFGRSDYARPADAIVVFGARAYADGRASRSLADRVRTGCALWREGRAPLLVLSGGPGDGAFHETEVMAALAREEGVPDEALVLDPDGTSTRATVRDVAALARERGLISVLAVSHGWHLPRVKMAFERAGVRACTVPARESRPFAKTTFLVAREVAALWVYWLEA